MDTLKIGVIIGSNRPGRFADKPGNWIFREAQKLDGVEVEMLDLKDWDFPFYDEPMGPSMLNRKYSHEIVTKWSNKIDALDAFIIVSPEYNHSTSAVLKNALDHIFPEWNRKPVGFVSYGSAGGARAVEHLRQIVAELEMASTRTSVLIPGSIQFPILFGKAEWNAETEAALKEKGDAMLGELLWWGKALKAARIASK